MNLRYPISFLLLLLLSPFCFANQGLIVGYLPTYRFSLQNDIEFERLTHVNLSFARTDEDGDLSFSTSISSLVTTIHNAEAKVLASIGGGGLSATEKGYYDELSKPENVRAFASKIKGFLIDNNLDGLDVDLEGEAIGPNYGDLIDALADTLKPEGLLLTAALGTWGATNVPSSALEHFDFINMMAYDATGPWNPARPGQHSSYEFAEDNIDYWFKQRGVSKDRLVLGVPFYGYDFGSDPVGSFTYGQILNNFPDDAPETKDQIGELYYNGAPTIEDKVRLALELEGLAGVMIWEIGQDALGEASLLKVISQVTSEVGLAERVPTETSQAIWPNPSVGSITIEAELAPEEVVVEIVSLSGEVKFRQIERSTSGMNTFYLNTRSLETGSYFVRLKSSEKIIHYRFFQNIY